MNVNGLAQQKTVHQTNNVPKEHKGIVDTSEPG